MLNDLRSRPDGCVSDLEFDEWRAGEVEPVRLGEIERHLASCDRCRGRRELLERDARAFLEQAPAWKSRSTGENAGRKKNAARWVAGAGAALALAAAAGVALLVRPASDVDGTRLKGTGAHIGFFVKRGIEVQRGANGERVRAGDQLRFTVTTIQRSFVAILSLDARGVASVYYPASGAAPSVNAGSDVALDGSVELDDTLGEERLYGLFCEAPIDVEAARATLARTGAKPSGSGCTTDSLRIVKERGP
jgi:hypothetical protein